MSDTDQFFVMASPVTAPLIGAAFREASDSAKADLLNEIANFAQAGAGLTSTSKQIEPHLTLVARRFVRALAREI